MVKCTKCLIEKPTDSFHKNSRNKSGYFYQCKVCINTHNLKWYNNNREKHRTIGRDWDEKNRAKKAEQKLKYRYNLTKEEYLKMHTDQDDKCAICKTSDQKLVVDHCHQSGKIRGLLCGSCNRALGLFKDNPNILLSSIEYLNNKN